MVPVFFSNKKFYRKCCERINKIRLFEKAGSFGFLLFIKLLVLALQNAEAIIELFEAIFLTFLAYGNLQ